MDSKIIHLEEFNLVHKFLTGNDEAGRKLYESVYDKLEMFIYSYTKQGILTANDKEEILSDTLETSIRKLERYSGKCSFYTFICGIAKNIILEKYRKAKKDFEFIKELKINEDIKEAEESICEYDDPVNIIIDKELIEAAKQAFCSLSQNHRDVLNLANMKYTAKRIKEIGGFSSEEAVYSMYRRAIISLKENFKKFYKNGDQF